MSRTPIHFAIVLLTLVFGSGCGSSVESDRRLAAQDSAATVASVLPSSPIDPLSSPRREEFNELRAKICSSFGSVETGTVFNLANLNHCALSETDEIDPSGKFFWITEQGVSCFADFILRDVTYYDEVRATIRATTAFRYIQKVTNSSGAPAGESSTECTDSAKAMLGAVRFELGEEGRANVCFGTLPCDAEAGSLSLTGNLTSKKVSDVEVALLKSGSWLSDGATFTLESTSYSYILWASWGGRCRAQVLLGGSDSEGAVQVVGARAISANADAATQLECTSREGRYRYALSELSASESTSSQLKLEKL